MEKRKEQCNFAAVKPILHKKLIAAGDTSIPHYKKFSLTSKEKYAIIKENGMSVKFYDGSNFDENNGYYRLC